MSRKFVAWTLLLALVLPMVIGACGPAATTEAPPEVIEADPSGQTVVFWHPWGSGSVAEGLTAIIEEFNTTNEWGITVDSVDQGRTSDVEDNFNAAIVSGDLPDLVVAYNDALDTWYSTGVLADMNAFIYDAEWGLSEAVISDYYEGAFYNAINAEGTRVGFPHGQSANVLFYNHTWAQELGFTSPPNTMEEMKEQACTATEANATDDDPDNDGTGGWVMNTRAENVASFLFALGEDFYDDAGTGYDFTKPEFVEIGKFWQELMNEGCAFTTESYPNPEFATRKALMVNSSTAGLPYQEDAFEAEDAYTDDVWGLIAFPGKDMKAIDAYVQNSAIVKSTPEKELATWIFMKWFTSPEINAMWIEASKYFPIRIGAVDYLDDLAATDARWGQGLLLVPLGQAEPAWASWLTVRREVGATYAEIIQGTEDDIMPLLEELNALAAEAIEELK